MPVDECVGGEAVGRGQGDSDIKLFLCIGDLASFKHQSRTEAFSWELGERGLEMELVCQHPFIHQAHARG